VSFVVKKGLSTKDAKIRKEKIEVTITNECTF